MESLRRTDNRGGEVIWAVIDLDYYRESRNRVFKSERRGYFEIISKDTVGSVRLGERMAKLGV